MSRGKIKIEAGDIDFRGTDYLGQPREFRGIFELAGDTLHLAYPNTNTGLIRPTTFISTATDDTLVIRAKRKLVDVAQQPIDPGRSAKPIAPNRSPEPNTELVRLNELPQGQNKSGPWLSPDGLSLYWSDKQGEIHSIWRAGRSGPGQPFRNATRIMGGHDLTLSADLTELIRVDYDPNPQRGQKFALFSARKTSASDRGFTRPHRKLTEMAGLSPVFAPCLSADGLTLYAEQFGDSALPPNVRFRRDSPDATWGEPEAVPLSGLTKAHLRFPFISADNRFLFGNNEDSPSGMVVLSSLDGGRTFGSPKPIKVPGDAVKGKFPRHCPATKELIFSESTSAKTAELYLIRNFDPEAMGN